MTTFFKTIMRPITMISSKGLHFLVVGCILLTIKKGGDAF